MNKITVTKLCCTEHDQAAEIGRGKIRDNALKAMVTSKLYQSKVEVPRRARVVLSVRLNIRAKSPIQTLLSMSYV